MSVDMAGCTAIGVYGMHSDAYGDPDRGVCQWCGLRAPTTTEDDMGLYPAETAKPTWVETEYVKGAKRWELTTTLLVVRIEENGDGRSNWWVAPNLGVGRFSEERAYAAGCEKTPLAGMLAAHRRADELCNAMFAELHHADLCPRNVGPGLPSFVTQTPVDPLDSSGRK